MNGTTFLYVNTTLSHAYIKPRTHAAETDAINSTPDSGASFFVPTASATEKTGAIYGVEIDNGRQRRHSSFHLTYWKRRGPTLYENILSLNMFAWRKGKLIFSENEHHLVTLQHLCNCGTDSNSATYLLSHLKITNKIRSQSSAKKFVKEDTWHDGLTN